MNRFEGRVVVVTGAASGIGRSIAERFGREGAHLVLGDVNAEALETVSAQLAAGPAASITPVVGDLTQREGAVELVGSATGKHGQIDVLINCAGGGVILPTSEHTEETLRATIDRNLWTTLYVTLEALPHMVERQYGRIVNIGAESVRNGLYRHAIYNAAKGGVHALGTGLAREYAEAGITVNTVAPAWVVTEEAAAKLAVASPEEQRDMDVFGAQMRNLIPMGRPGTVEEVSAAVAFIASEEASYVTGQVISVNGGSSML